MGGIPVYSTSVDVRVPLTREGGMHRSTTQT